MHDYRTIKIANLLSYYYQLENVFIKHYAPNHKPDPIGE